MEFTKMRVDGKDLAILDLLQYRGRMTTTEVAQQVNLSDTPCLRRIKKLEQEGIIKGYQAILDREKLNLSILVYALVRLNANSDKLADEFESEVEALEQVMECSVITGSYDYLLKIVAKDLSHYESFVKKSLGQISSIAAIESTVVLKQTFSRNQLPLKTP